MFNNLSSALFYGTLGYSAFQYTKDNLILNKNETLPTSLIAPISIATHSLLDYGISLIGKNYLPKNVRTVMTFAGAVFATKEILYYYGAKLGKKHYENAHKPVFKINGWDLKAKHLAIASIVGLILFLK